MKINDKGQCPYQSSTWMCFSEHESHSAAGDCLVRLVERRGQPGDASACSGASCSFRPGALCGMRIRRARGMSLVEGVGGLISAIGPGSGMGVDWGHGVDTGPGGCGHDTDTGPGGCGFGKGRSWELGGRGRPDLGWGGGGGLVVSGLTETFWVAGSPVVWPGTIMMGVREMTGVYFLRNFLLRRVKRSEPSTRTTYWSNCRTSTTMPVLSHLVGWGPVWF